MLLFQQEAAPGLQAGIHSSSILDILIQLAPKPWGPTEENTFLPAHLGLLAIPTLAALVSSMILDKLKSETWHEQNSMSSAEVMQKDILCFDSASASTNAPKTLPGPLPDSLP